MLGELPVFDAPDIDGPERESFPRRANAAYGLGVRWGKSAACDDPIAGNDAVLDAHLDVRHRGEDPSKILDLGGETRRTSARMLNVGYGMDLGKRPGIVSIHRRHIS